MPAVLNEITMLIIRGRANAETPYPPDLAGQPGVKEKVEQAISEGIEPGRIIKEGMIPGMEDVGQKFTEGEYFLPDMLMSAQAMKAGMAVLEPLMAGDTSSSLGTVILGTVKGDMHDIGKNLVGVMLEGGGFTVHDLGIDVAAEKFVEQASQNPDAVVGMSALLTTTREAMRATIDALRAAGMTNKVIVGGAAIGRTFADDIQADGFSNNAADAVPMVKQLLGSSA
jgi:5-methyltetrahydrofolate--homocysteine methyltransferase